MFFLFTVYCHCAPLQHNWDNKSAVILTQRVGPVDGPLRLAAHGISSRTEGDVLAAGIDAQRQDHRSCRD